MRALLATVVLIGATLDARAGSRGDAAPAVFEAPCVDPACSRRALDHFRAALAAQRAGTATRPLRISYIGDSLTADDYITQRLRSKLADLVGDGGPGFVFAAAPHPYCRHRAVTRVTSGTWRVHGISSSPAPDRLLGLGGSAESEGAASIRFSPIEAVTSVDLHYLAQPRGGKLAVLGDGVRFDEISTTAEHKRAAFVRIAVPAGTRKIELRATGRVRLFGAALEAAKGAVVDNLGVVNATAKQLSKNNLPAHWRNQLAHRDADLVILMLGTNEAEWLAPNGAGMVEHERLYGEVLASVRQASPSASCLVISPLDQLDWRVEGHPPRTSIPAMVDAQRRAATTHGCAFWDTYQWMGGKGSSGAWHRRGLVVKDYQHPTTAGAARIAEALFAGLVSPAAPAAPR